MREVVGIGRPHRGNSCKLGGGIWAGSLRYIKANLELVVVLLDDIELEKWKLKTMTP